MAIQQISVFLENKPGTLAEMTGVLADAKIDMRALSLAETKDFGIARLIVDDVYEASHVLKEAGFVNSLTPVVGVLIPNEPGGLNRILQVFTEEKVNIEYMYAFMGGSKDHAYMLFRVGKDMEKTAEAALAAKGFRLVSQDEIKEM